MTKQTKINAFKTALRSFVNNLVSSHNSDNNAHSSILSGYATSSHTHNNYALISSLSDVAFSGDYEDLLNTPVNNTLLNMTVVYTDSTTTTIPLLVTTSNSISS